MSSQLKHRLVGASVLAGVVAISWPFVFDQTPRVSLDQNTQIPVAPGFQKFSVATQLAPSDSIDNNSSQRETDSVAKVAPSNFVNASTKKSLKETKTAKGISHSNQTPSDVGEQTQIDKVNNVEKQQKAVDMDQTGDKKNTKSDTEKKVLETSKKNVVLDGDDVKPRLDKQGVPVSWVVQIASFRRINNAEKLKKQLVEKGIKAYVRSIEASKGYIYRVFAGPEVDKRRAKQLQGRLEASLSLDTLLVRFKPL